MSGPQLWNVEREIKRIADIIRAAHPKLSDEEIMVMLWRHNGALNDALSRARHPDRTGR